MELTAPQSTKDHVVVAVIIQDRGVDTISARDGVWLWLEFAVWFVGFSHADFEDAILVLGWKVEIENAVLLSRIGSPELL